MMIQKKNKQKNKIPKFSNREDEAKFWETHSIANYLNELKPVKVRFAKNLSEGLHVRLDTSTLTKLRKEARGKGIGPTTLVRMWIIEQLNSFHKQA